MSAWYEWYLEIPLITRCYLTASVITTAVCALDIVSPFSLYFNAQLVIYRFQVWRLFTNFFFFGAFGLDFLFHMFFLVRYCRLLEEGSFRGRTADFLTMLLFGGSLMCCVAPFINVPPFLGSSLAFMMVYVWGRRNEYVRLSFLGLFQFRAPFLPWVLLVFSLLLGNSPVIDLIGIAVGHIYYFLEDVFPTIPAGRGRKVLVTPYVLHLLLGTSTRADPAAHVPVRIAHVEDEQQPLRVPQAHAQQPPAEEQPSQSTHADASERQEQPEEE